MTVPARRSPLVLALVSVMVLALLLGLTPSSSNAAPAKILGSGSTYVALAMQQWVADAQTQGLPINYSAVGSSQGLTGFANNTTDFGATEAEFSALQTSDPARGFQYVPDVAGAVAVMYNVSDAAGRKVDYLHLSRETIARIFMGDISRWSDPAIAADNPLPSGNLVLPDQEINVVYRSNQSGTTGLFYDFVSHTAPDLFATWAARNGFPTGVRIIQLDTSPGFAPKTQAFGGSEQIAQYIAGGAGQWSIGYDEFGYAQTYGAPSAWVENAAGQWVKPYAENISEALKSATLRPDLSQELSGVYSSTNPLAYPISAYSYIVTQCAPSADRPTCKGAYSNTGVSETLTTWLRYIACEGQVNMAQIGYSPLPVELSQEVANSIARLEGKTPEVLNAANCANPRFTGGMGPLPPREEDPLGPTIAEQAGDDGGGGGAGAGESTGGGTSTADSTEVAAGEIADVGTVGSKKSAGGGSGEWQEASPVKYDRPGTDATKTLPMILLLAAILVVPPVVLGIARRRRR